eukprot:TRINITY_DN2666_c0_g1_i15.p1 TRINITY_DN2666_c0_g1~~TRINITY_DN2666_c0_g1_i15.p1  ORF type:complete len:584 (-),score=126.82 TRINITY_DN2666_c0_g1_i15:236-1987(-)
MKPAPPGSGLRSYALAEVESLEQAKYMRKKMYIRDQTGERRTKLGDKRCEFNILIKQRKPNHSNQHQGGDQQMMNQGMYNNNQGGPYNNQGGFQGMGMMQGRGPNQGFQGPDSFQPNNPNLPNLLQKPLNQFSRQNQFNQMPMNQGPGGMGFQGPGRGFNQGPQGNFGNQGMPPNFNQRNMGGPGMMQGGPRGGGFNAGRGGNMQGGPGGMPMNGPPNQPGYNRFSGPQGGFDPQMQGGGQFNPGMGQGMNQGRGGPPPMMNNQGPGNMAPNMEVDMQAGAVPSGAPGTNIFEKLTNLIAQNLQNKNTNPTPTPQPQMSSGPDDKGWAANPEQIAQAMPGGAKPRNLAQALEMKKEMDTVSNVVWSGFITRNRQHRVGVDASLISGSDSCFSKLYNLNISHRTSMDDVQKKPILGLVTFTPSNDTQIGMFEEYTKYFTEKKRAGVVQLSDHNIYILPPCEAAFALHKFNDNELLGVISDSVSTDAEGRRGMKAQNDYARIEEGDQNTGGASAQPPMNPQQPMRGGMNQAPMQQSNVPQPTQVWGANMDQKPSDMARSMENMQFLTELLETPEIQKLLNANQHT